MWSDYLPILLYKFTIGKKCGPDKIAGKTEEETVMKFEISRNIWEKHHKMFFKKSYRINRKLKMIILSIKTSKRNKGVNKIIGIIEIEAQSVKTRESFSE